MISQSKKIVTSGYNYLCSFLIRSSSSLAKGYYLLNDSKISGAKKKHKDKRKEKFGARTKVQVN